MRSRIKTIHGNNAVLCKSSIQYAGRKPSARDNRTPDQIARDEREARHEAFFAAWHRQMAEQAARRELIITTQEINAWEHRRRVYA